MLKAGKYSLIAIMLSGLTYLIYLGIKIALADLSHYPLKNLIENQQNNITEQAAASAELKILKSIQLRPNNAEYHEYLARLYYLRAINNSADTRAYQEYLKLAYNTHRKASQLRPEWPYSWANMALMKSRMQQFDVAFLYSINQAIKYGPWEIASNQAIVQAIFSNWNGLNQDSQNKAVQALERIYRQQKATARSLLQHYQLADVVCPRISLDDFQKDGVCKLKAES